MALPSKELGNIYSAGQCISDTDNKMEDFLYAHRTMKEQMQRQAAVLRDARENLTSDLSAERVLPYATQCERMRLYHLLSICINWLSETVAAMDIVISILDHPPRGSRLPLYAAQPSVDHA